MDFIKIGSKNLCLYLRAKVLDGLLTARLRHHKDKRPPPIAGQSFDTAVPIWFPQFNQSFQGG